MTQLNQKQASYSGREPAHCYDILLLDRKRLKRGYTFKDLSGLICAKYKGIGVQEREIGRIFALERRFPRPTWVCQIADILGVDMDEVIIENPRYSKQQSPGDRR